MSENEEIKNENVEQKTATSGTETPAVKKTAKPPRAGKKGNDNARITTGRRKVSIARTKLVSGKGVFTVNKKPIADYFRRSVDVHKVMQPLKVLGLEGSYDVKVNVSGGGTSGQAEAIRMGIARSLKEINPEYHKKMREEGFLTRDSRMVERKKYGLHKARRASQFSKR